MLKRRTEFSSKDLKKVVELLEIMATTGERRSVSELSRKAGLSRYKATRLLKVLDKKGLTERALQYGKSDADGARRWAEKLAEDVQELQRASAAEPASPQNSELYGIIINDVRPVLEFLARRHNEAMYVVIPNGEEVLFLDMVDCAQSERPDPVVGKRSPFFSNAAGKVMRAIDSWDLLEKIGRRWRRSRRGRYPDLGVLRAELEQIREKGVAVESNGMGEGLITVAVAIRDYAGKVVGALMMLGPSFRLFGDRLEVEIIPSLRLSAESLSMKFGYARP